MEDDWNYVSDSSGPNIDDRILQSDPSPQLKHPGGDALLFTTRSEPSIEDSDWNDAEVVI